MRFVLEITMDNDAFTDNAGGEVSRILRGLVTKLEYTHLEVDECKQLIDYNGNKVGSWTITE